MNSPVAAFRPTTFKPAPNSGDKNNFGNQLQPQHSELAVTVSLALSTGRDSLDNHQKLHHIDSLLNNASGDELNNLIQSLPNNTLKQWAKEIQSSATTNSGLSADQRQEFFSLMGRELTPAQARRFQSALPESLQDEFSSVVTRYSITREPQLGAVPNTTDGKQDSLFSLGNSIDARRWQASISQEPAVARDTAQATSKPPKPATLQTTTPANSEQQAITDAIDTIAPNASKEVKQQLVDAYAKVKTAIDTLGTPGNDSKALVKTMQETNNLFRQHGLGDLLPTDRHGKINFTYNSSNLPKELSRLQHTGNSKSVEFGHPDWKANVSPMHMPNALLLRSAEQLLAKPLSLAEAIYSKQFDTERGFAPSKVIDSAVMNLEQSVFANGAPDTNALFTKMQTLDAQLATEDGVALTKTENGETYVSAQLLRFATDSGELNAAANNEGWINTSNLSDKQFVIAADQQRTDVLSARLDETGTSDLDTATRGITALNPDGTEQENQKLANQYLKLQRSIQLASRNPDLQSNVLSNLVETDRLFKEAGMPSVLPTANKRGHIRIRFDSSTLPPELMNRSHARLDRDTGFGDPGWHVDVSLRDLPPANLIDYAKSLLESIPAKAALSNLSQMDKFADYPITHSADIQAMMDSAQPVPLGTDTSSEPVLGDLLQKFSTESKAPESKYDYRALADTSYLVASSLLTDSTNGMSQEEMKTLLSWVDAESLTDIDFHDKIVTNLGKGDTHTEHLGVHGNFGKTKHEFAQAWLGSTKEQRLDYLGIDKGRWTQAQPFISTAINSDMQAHAIEKAEFGFFDFVKLVVVGAFSYVTAGAASSAVSGMFSGGTAVASTATTTFLSGAAGAATAGFTSTLILTDGDIEEALKSGLMGALTGGLSKYVGTLQGTAKPVAQAIVMGLEAELSGKDFKDGVLASVAKGFGAGVADKLKPHMPEFIAGFAGKTTEVAIRTGGDKELMQQELEQYVINFAAGQATAKLTSVVGDDYQYVAESLGDLSGVIVASGGDMSKVRQYLHSDKFYASLGDNLGAQVTESFGGKEKFSAAVYGKITNIIVASRGDKDKIATNVEGLALSVAGEWASNKLSTQIDNALGEKNAKLAEVLGSLTNVAISSSWDANAINVFMNGPLLAALKKEAAGLIPDHFKNADDFLGRALERLTQSYQANKGDIDAVANAMTQFIANKNVNTAE